MLQVQLLEECKEYYVRRAIRLVPQVWMTGRAPPPPLSEVLAKMEVGGWIRGDLRYTEI